MTWQSVGTHTFVPTDKAVEVGSFDLAAGQDTIWVKITQLNDPADWPFSYGILSWRNANGTPLGSIKAYSNRLGEVFRLGNGLPPSDGVGSLWFEPRGFNLGWLKAGFPWELKFEAQAGASDLTSGYWNRDPDNQVITPKTSGDNLDMTPGWIKAKNLIITDEGSGGSDDRSVPGYQQGNWNPRCEQGAIGTVTSPNWYRIGNCITIQAKLTGWTDTTSTQLIDVRGFPYDNADDVTIGVVRVDRVDTGGDQIVAVVGGGPFNRVLFQKNRDSAPSSAITHANLLNSDAAFSFSAVYRTEDTTWKPINGASIT